MTKHTFLTLTPEQRQELESVVRTGQYAARKQTRARVLLLLDRSQDTTRTDDAIAEILGCHCNTVGNTAPPLSQRRTGSHPHRQTDGAAFAPQNDRRTRSANYLACLLRRARRLKPLDASPAGRPSGRTGLCRKHQSCHRWRDAKKNEIKPWRVQTWCIGKPSAQYVSKMEDVLDVYQRPYDADYPVVCFDETRKELHGSPAS